MQRFIVIIFLLINTSIVAADSSDFTMGPLIKSFGPNIEIAADFTFEKGTKFKIAFDMAKAAEKGQLNRKLVSLARFLNMHVRAGVKPDNIELVMVAHGGSLQDLFRNDVYQAKFDTENTNIELLKELMSNNVRVVVCGQSAAYYGHKQSDMVEGIEFALSAMTAHAVLQQQGFTVNPF